MKAPATLLLSTLLLLPTVLAGAPAHQEAAEYVALPPLRAPTGLGQSAPLAVPCEADKSVGGRSIGGACLPVRAGDRAVDVRIEDAAGGKVGAAVWFRFPDGRFTWGAWVCGGARGIPVPAGADAAQVIFDAPTSVLVSAIKCPDVLDTSAATVGTVRATFWA